MGSHFQCLGFDIYDEDSFLKNMDMLFKYEKRYERIETFGDVSYAVVGIGDNMQFYFVYEEEKLYVRDYEIFYRTPNYFEVVDYKWHSDSKYGGRCRITLETGQSFDIDVPNKAFNPVFDENKRYCAQLTFLGETYSLYENIEEYENNTNEDTKISEKFFGVFPDEGEDVNRVYFGGIVKKVDIVRNEMTSIDYYEILLDTYFGNLVVHYDIDSFEDGIKEGNILFGVYGVLGKIIEKYIGSECGDMRINKNQSELKNIETLDDLYNVLVKSYSTETTHPNLKGEWNKINRAMGHCAVDAMIVQHFFGGDVYKIKMPYGDTHYFNVIDGNIIDLSSEEFSYIDWNLDLTKDQIYVDPEYCGTNPNTRQRFEILLYGIMSNDEKYINNRRRILEIMGDMFSNEIEIN